MGAYVCSACVVAYPVKTEYQTCPLCGKPCVHESHGEPSEDFQWRLDLATDPPEEVDWYRVERLQRVGVPTEVALDWAKSTQLDLHDTCEQFPDLVSKGATVDQAVQILTPLW